MSSDLKDQFDEIEGKDALSSRKRYIYPLKGRKRTRTRFAVFDCETRTIESTEFKKAKYPAKKIELRYVYARLRDESGNYNENKTFDFNTEIDAPDKGQKLFFTQQLIEWGRTNNYLVAWAHNSMFDACAAIDFDYLSRGTREYKFEFTFVSTHPFILKIHGHPREKGKKGFLIKILDTYSFYKYSLEKLAPYFKMTKVGIDFEEYERRGKEVPQELLIERCKSDVEITDAIVRDLYSRMNGRVSVSAPQMAYNTFRMMLDRPIEKLGGLSIESYHGGRTEIFKRMAQENAIRLDVNSMYPWAMCQPLPIAHGKHTINPNLDEIIRNCQSGKYLATIRAIVNIPHKYISPFPYWDGERLLFPSGKFEVVINSPEFMALDNYKYIERVLEADTFRAEPFLELYARKFYAAKLAASLKKDQVGREYNKLLLNSLFGKFGQKQKETKPLPKELLALCENHVDTGVEDIEIDIDYPQHGLSKGDVIHAVFIAGQPVFSQDLDYNISPAVASFITSWSRSRLFEFMETRAGNELIYVDTDCLVVPERVENRFKNVIGNSMGMLKREFKGTFIGFAPKVYIFNGVDSEGEKKIEVKSKGVPRDKFLKAIKDGKKAVTFSHVLGFHERLRRYHTVSLLQSNITRKLSLTDSKREWNNDQSMSLILNTA